MNDCNDLSNVLNIGFFKTINGTNYNFKELGFEISNELAEKHKDKKLDLAAIENPLDFLYENKNYIKDLLHYSSDKTLSYEEIQKMSGSDVFVLFMEVYVGSVKGFLQKTPQVMKALEALKVPQAKI